MPSINPFDEAKRLFLEGISHFEADRFSEALTAFEASLALLPGRVSTLGNVGITLLMLGRPQDALAVLDEALAADPAYADAWAHRGATLAALGRHEEALVSQDRVLALNAASVPALYQRALMLNALGRFEEALKATTQLIAHDAKHASGLSLRGELFHRLGRLDQALAAFDKLLALNPGGHDAWSRRAGILKEAGRTQEAISSYKQAVAFGGDAALNGYFIASLSGSEAPVSAPRKYIEALFDDYAGEFDEHLVKVLGYRAHNVLVDNLQGLGKAHYRSALDLGCGTGLCGPLLEGRVDRIDGVDLSSAMLGKARALGIYQSLVHADVAEYLQGTDQRYDLVLSCDVFIYVGALEAVFAGVQRVLEPGGMFCFSVELADDADDYTLTTGQRYAHSERYLRSLAQASGFSVEKILAHPIREEQGQAIDGLFVYLKG